jgi:multisubunit Na+/H+ antiporter MnhG subunit
VRATFAWVLLAGGGVIELLAVLGVVLMRDALDRLHYVSASSVASALIVAAVIVRESASQITIYASLVAAFLLFTGPILVHVTGRAILIRRRGSR